VNARDFASFTLTTPNSADILTLDQAAPNTGRVSGTSGGVALEPLTFFNVTTVIVNTAANDASGSDNDSITIAASGINATGLKTLKLNVGTGNNTLTVNGGTTTIDTTPGLGGVNLSVTVNNSAVVTLPGDQTLAALGINNSAAVDLVNGSLTISKTGPTTSAQVFDYLASGRNGGAWDGVGLFSSTAANRALTDGFTGLAMGWTPEGNIRVKYTWNGDVNLDELVNADDYFAVDSGFITQAGGYENGDLNYDGFVNADDYFLIDSAFIGQSSGLSAAPSAPSPDVLTIPQSQRPQKKQASSVLSQLFSTKPVL